MNIPGWAWYLGIAAIGYSLLNRNQHTAEKLRTVNAPHRSPVTGKWLGPNLIDDRIDYSHYGAGDTGTLAG